jgi:S1-C subfamily serine protease
MARTRALDDPPADREQRSVSGEMEPDEAGASGAARLAAIVLAAALAGGLGGAALELAVGGGREAETPPATPAPATTPAAAAGSGLPAQTIYARDGRGVVVVTATLEEQVPTLFGPAEQQVSSLGSGFVVDARGHVVTNEHVVGTATEVRVGFGGGATYPAAVLGADPSTDVAVLRVDAPASVLHPLRFGDSRAVRVGDPVYAIGNPFGLERTMTAGIVSATGRDIAAPNGLGIADAIQTDAPINHGNSGGPLLDRAGLVIGVNDQIESGGAVDANVGVGFAIPASTVQAVARQLIAGGHVEHAYLGVEAATVTPELAQAAQGVPAHGALVLAVAPGSPAAVAGLRAAERRVDAGGRAVLAGGDTIVSVDAKPVRTSAELADAVRAHRPGDRLALGVEGPGGGRTVRVTLAPAPGAR